MTLLFRCITLTSCVLSQFASAQGVVRSGEHGSFTRLVMPIEEVSTWSIQGERRRRNLVFAPEIELYFDQLFERINTTRLAGLSATEEGYQISLNCDCYVDAFDYQQSYLVVDIYDIAPAFSFDQTPETSIVRELDRQEANDGQSQENSSNRNVGDSRLTLNTMLQMGVVEAQTSATASSLTFGLRHHLHSPHDVSNPLIPDDMNTVTERIAEASGELARQIARASSSQLLQPRLQLSRPTRAPSAEQPPANINSDQLPIRSATAFDIVTDQNLILSSDAHNLSCDQSINRIDEWSLDLGFEQQIGELRANLFDMNGEIVISRAIDLARYYIFYGLGAEAEHWIIQAQETDRPELAISRYLDGEPGPNFPEIASTALCSGQDILWRFIDGALYHEIQGQDLEKLTRAFLELPKTLRRRIGPDLVRQLHDAGHQNIAEDLREAVSIGLVLTQHEELSLALEIDSHSPLDVELDTALQMLENSSTQAPYRMARYLAVARAQSFHVPMMVQEAAEALLMEHDTAYDANSLWHELALTYASSNDVSSFINLIDSIPFAEPADRLSLIERAFEILLERQLDASTLVLAIQTLRDTGVGPLDQITRNQISQVLVDLGLNSIAQQYRYQDIAQEHQNQPREILDSGNDQTPLSSIRVEGSSQQANQELSAHQIQTLVDQSEALRNHSYDLINQ